MAVEEWPGWLQRHSQFFPEGFLADYISFDRQAEQGGEQNQEASLLLLLAAGLGAYTLTFQLVGRGKSACEVSGIVVPLTRVRSVERVVRIDAWEDGSEERGQLGVGQSGLVLFDGEIGDWGQEIKLPLTELDYGSKASAAKAARSFLGAVQREIQSRVPAG